MDPINQASILGAGQALVPNYLDQSIKQQLAPLQIQNARLQNDAQSLQNQAARAAADEQGQFHTDLQQVMLHPSTENMAGLILKHPKYAEQVKAAHGMLDKAQQQKDLTSMGSVFAAASNGKYDLAANLLESRIAADTAAGHPPDATDAALLQAFKSNDPKEQKAAVGMIGPHLAALVGPDKFSEVYGALTKDKGYTLGQGQTRFNDDNEQVASVAPENKLAIIPQGGSAVMYSPSGPLPGTSVQGNAAPATPETPSGGGKGGTPTRTHGFAPRERDGGDNDDAAVDGKIASLSKALGIDPDKPLTREQIGKLSAAIPATEGGAGSRAARNNNPGNLKDGPFVKKMAGYLGADDAGYAKFANAGAGQDAMTALLQHSYFDKGQQTIRDIVEGRPVKAGKSADGSPGYAIIQGNPKGDDKIPIGFRWADSKHSKLEPIPGGPADGEKLGPGDLQMMGQQYLAGDKSVLQNLGRGRQGAANVVALRKEIARQATAAGMSGRDIAAQMAEFSGLVAGERTLGTRTANAEMASTEFQQLAPLALQASHAASRSGFVPLAKAQQMIQAGTNDPNLRRFVASNTSLINVYARAISPTGVPTVSDKEHGRDMLSTAYDEPSYSAVVDQMSKEIAAARRSPGAVRGEFRRAISGNLPVMKSPQDAMRLPSGTHFRTPDGREKVRP